MNDLVFSAARRTPYTGAMHRAIFFASMICIVCVSAAAAQPATPTVRPLATDRPDRTESPFSVPGGWFQFESDLVSHGEFSNDEGTVTGTSIASLNLKYGITQRMDVQFLFSPWVSVHREAPGVDDTDDGTGQAGVRAKFNLTGNDQGHIAAALLPFVFVPTRGDAILDSPTWGMVAPAAIDLGDGRAMSGMLGVMSLESDNTWVIGSVSFASPIAGSFAGFFEVYVATAFDSDAGEDVTADTGITFAPSDDWQFDVGVYYGITDPTEDWRVFAGASARFPLAD